MQTFYSMLNCLISFQKTWRKFYKYNIDIDEKQDDKANEILLCSFERPHMRAFHCSWIAFFVAFFVWFCIGPLLPYIADDLGLTKKEIWTSSIAGVGSTIAVRFALGPLCDVYGPRVLMAAVLCFSAIPTACTGLIRNATDLIVLRCFIGVAGGSFVMCQYWTSRMFCKEVVGTANALAGGKSSSLQNMKGQLSGMTFVLTYCLILLPKAGGTSARESQIWLSGLTSSHSSNLSRMGIPRLLGVLSPSFLRSHPLPSELPFIDTVMILPKEITAS